MPVLTKQPVPAVTEPAVDANVTKAEIVADTTNETDQNESPPVIPQNIYELFDNEDKVQKMLAFVLDDLLSYQDEVQQMLAECKNSVQIALDVVPRMIEFVETTMRRGLRQGILNDKEAHDDEEGVPLKEGMEESQEEEEEEKKNDESPGDDNDDDVDGDESSLETKGDAAEKEAIPPEDLGDTTYDHIVLDLKGFLSIASQLCTNNTQSPLHSQLMLFEKKFIPFKKDGAAVGFK